MQPVNSASFYEGGDGRRPALNEDPLKSPVKKSLDDFKAANPAIRRCQGYNLDTVPRFVFFGCNNDAANPIVGEAAGIGRHPARGIDHDPCRTAAGDPAHSERRIVEHNSADTDGDGV